MILEQGIDVSHVQGRLAASGMSGTAAGRLAAAFDAVARDLLAVGMPPDRPVWAGFVPGRIEVLGKHTDYAGGSSLVCAVERGFCLMAVRGKNRGLRVRDASAGLDAVFQVDAGLEARAGHWSDYPRTVARRVARNFEGTLFGGHVAFAGTLPPAAGMSSSSALIAGTFLAMAALNDLENHPAWRRHLPDRTALAQYLGTIENGRSFGALTGDGGVGTFGGSQDHLAILCAEPGLLSHFSYGPVRQEGTVPMPEGLVFVVGVSGVRAAKTGAARDRYNRAAWLAAEVVRVWNAATGRTDPHLGAVVQSPGFDPERLRRLLHDRTPAPLEPADLIDRFDHFYNEQCRILPAAVEALHRGDLAAFGRFVDCSMEGAVHRLKNQVPETIHLARAAREGGAVAASAFGAGFGGAVWALVPAAEVQAFREAWAARYAETFPQRAGHAGFFVERPGPAAFQL